MYFRFVELNWIVELILNFFCVLVFKEFKLVNEFVFVFSIVVVVSVVVIV